MIIRALIFDFGGVLVRHADAPGRRKWAQRLGISEAELDSLVHASEISQRAALGLLPEIAIWQNIGRQYGLNDHAIAQLEHDFWLGEFIDEALLDLLRSVRPRLKTAVLSNAWSEARLVFSQKFGLDQEVDLMVISAEEGLVKPDARIYHLTVERLGVRPQEAVFVDDRLENIEGASAVGMHGVHFQDSARTIAAVRALLDGAESSPTIPEQGRDGEPAAA